MRIVPGTFFWFCLGQGSKKAELIQEGGVNLIIYPGVVLYEVENKIEKRDLVPNVSQEEEESSRAVTCSGKMANWLQSLALFLGARLEMAVSVCLVDPPLLEIQYISMIALNLVQTIMFYSG